MAITTEKRIAYFKSIGKEFLNRDCWNPLTHSFDEDCGGCKKEMNSSVVEGNNLAAQSAVLQKGQ